MKKIAIIGAGQQGASIARALCDQSDQYKVSVYDHSESATAEFAKVLHKDGVPSQTLISNTLKDCVSDADIVVLATPIDVFGAILEAVQNDIKAGAIVTDIGSGKESAIITIKQNLPDGASYIPVHPIEGRAGVGAKTSDAKMYHGAKIAVVDNENGRDAQQLVETMWEDIGGTITYMSAFEHDRMYGMISHFQHVIAFSSVLGGINDCAEISKDYKNGGNILLDTTRIAKASAPMWLAIFKDNKSSILSAADGFRSELEKLVVALEKDNPAALHQYLKSVHNFRRQIKEERPREAVSGEVSDWGKEQPTNDKNQVGEGGVLNLTNALNENSMVELADRTLLPTLISAAVTGNAMELQKTLNVSIAENSNPSFRDGTSAMLTNPEYLTNLLYSNRDVLLKRLKGNFLPPFDHVVQAIHEDNSQEQKGVIEFAGFLRDTMPSHKSASEMRRQFIIPKDTSPVLAGAS